MEDPVAPGVPAVPGDAVVRVTRVPVRPDPVRPVRPLTSLVGARTVRIRRMTTGVDASAVPIMCASRASATAPVANAPLTVISAAVRPFRALPTVTGADRPSSSLAQHDTAEARAARAEHLVRFSALKQLAAKGKIAAIIAWVTDFLAGDASRKIVLFAHHQEVVHALGAAFGCAEITGETNDQRRQDAVEAFQTNPSIRVIAGNIRAGGVGITLTAASDVLFAEQDWNPGVHDQAEDRINRIGQVNACTAWYFLGQDTIDQDLCELIEAKRGIVNAGTDGDVQTGTGIVHSLVAGLRRRAKATAPKAIRAARKATPVA